MDLSTFGVTAEEIFEQGDEDGNGELSFSEFSRCFLKIGLPAGIDKDVPEPEPTEDD